MGVRRVNTQFSTQGGRPGRAGAGLRRAGAGFLFFRRREAGLAGQVAEGAGLGGRRMAGQARL